MALFDYAAGEVIAKIVYFGPERAGKTTNLRHIHAKLPAPNRGELVIATTETGSRSLVFDFVLSEAGRVRGLRMRVQLCTFSGASLSARRAVLKAADGVVFVADSQAAALAADVQSFESLQGYLPQDPGELVPLVVQYNKRDVPTALSVETLNRKLNPRGVPSFEAIASDGIGVDETLRVITRACFRALVDRYGGTEGMSVASPAAEAADAPESRASGRHARILVSKRDLPSALPPPQSALEPASSQRARLPTHQSLARESLAGAFGTPGTRRTETLPLTKLEDLRRAEAQPEDPQKTTPGMPPSKGK